MYYFTVMVTLSRIYSNSNENIFNAKMITSLRTLGKEILSRTVENTANISTSLKTEQSVLGTCHIVIKMQ